MNFRHPLLDNITIRILATLVLSIVSAAVVYPEDWAIAALRQPDQRLMAPALTYPWNLVGRIEHRIKDNRTGKLVTAPGRLTCSGTLVADDLVVTTASCIVSTEPPSLGLLRSMNIYFRPQFLTEAVRVKAYYVGTTFTTDLSHENDFAILKLESKIGKGWRLPATFDLDDETAEKLPLFAAGLFRDKLDGKKPAFDPECRIITGGPTWKSNCSIESNSLGGPLFYLPTEGDAILIGIHAYAPVLLTSGGPSAEKISRAEPGYLTEHVKAHQFLFLLSKAEEGSLEMHALP